MSWLHRTGRRTTTTTTSTPSSDAKVAPEPEGQPSRARRSARSTATPSTGRVLTVDRGRYTVLVDEGTPRRARADRVQRAASCARRRSSPATGSTSSATPRGDEGSLARIVRIQPRDDPAAPQRRRHRRRSSGSSSPTPTRCSSSSPPRTRSRGRGWSTATSSRPSTPASRRSCCITKTDLADPAVPRELRGPRPPGRSPAPRTTCPIEESRTAARRPHAPSRSGTPASASRRS